MTAMSLEIDLAGQREVRVAVIAAYPTSRAGLRALLESSDGFRVVADLPLHSPLDGDVDVFVVEVEDPAALVFDAAEVPGVPAVYLWPPATPVPGAFSGTPSAHLLKDATAAEIAAAINSVVLGLSVFDPAILAASAGAGRGVSPTGTDDLDGLTERERQVLELLADGMTNKAIALRLGISDHTVKFHVGAILSKLGAESRTEAVTLAHRGGFLPL
jgi:two-component system, NarL family, nitrate/nitrite response regulator NarL